MEDWAAVAVVAIIAFAVVVLRVVRVIFTPSAGTPREKSDRGDTTHNQKELFDLAMRLQNRVETLERLLDTTQPEWRGKL